jgi:hypothetical protein
MTGLDQTQHGEEAYGLLGGVTALTGQGSGGAMSA